MRLDETQRAAEASNGWGDSEAVGEPVNHMAPDQGDAIGPARFTGVVDVNSSPGDDAIGNNPTSFYTLLIDT